MLALTGAMLATRIAAATPPTFTEVTVHDPSIVRDGSKYYVFGSHLASASSKDLLHWTQLSTSAAKGNALVPDPAAEFAETLSWAQTTTFWAPDVIRLKDGRYYFYYCACKGDSPRSALGVAVADKITGPYKNKALFLKSGMWDQISPDGTIYDATKHPNVVDPAVFFDAKGKLWMVYGSYSGGIFIMELDAKSGLPKKNQGYGKKLIGGNHARIEAPYILYSPETKYYYLFLSYGGLAADGGYNIRVARSRQPDGPYLDSAGNELTHVAGKPGTLFDDASIAPYGTKLMGNYQFLRAPDDAGTVSRGYVSPGHCSAYYDKATGQYFLVFHTRFVGRGEQHEVRVHPMFLNAKGWFVVGPHRYAGERAEFASAGYIPGDYKLIQHGLDITASVKTSKIITLTSAKKITGAATGTWKLTGDYGATIKLGSTTYYGVFVRQWDDDNQRYVQTFSALSKSGKAIWGSKVAVATANSAPVVTAMKNVTIAKSSKSAALPVIIWDAETVTSSLKLTAKSSKTSVVAKSGLKLGGAGMERTLKITPVKGKTGKTTITLTASDGQLTGKTTFKVTVQNKPTISKIAAQKTKAGKATSKISFKVSDKETSASKLKVTRSSSNKKLVPTANIKLGGSGSKRTVQITPAKGKTGTATIKLTVSDGSLTASRSFKLTVTK